MLLLRGRASPRRHERPLTTARAGTRALRGDSPGGAIARATAFARETDLSLAAGSLTGQARTAGLAGELSVSLLPVVFGSGARFFGGYATPPVRLGNP